MILLVFSSAAARAADADPAALAYQHAVSLYSVGDAAGALASMRESYRLSGRWELLYNIARLEDELGDCSAALSDYRQYLERVPHGQYRTAATQASAALSARCPSTEPAPPSSSPPPTAAPPAAPVTTPPDAPPTTTPETAPASAAVTTTSATTAPESPAPAAAPPADQPARADQRKTLRWIGWSALTAGGLAGVGAVYFTVSAIDARSRFRSSLAREASGGPYADFGLQDEQHRDEHWAQALAITGGALVSGGIVALMLGSRAPSSAGVTAGVWISPERVSAQLSSCF